MITFDVAAVPVSSKALAKERERNDLLIKKFRLAALPCLLIAILAGYLVGKLLSPDASDPEHFNGAIAAFTTGLGTAVAPLWLFLHFFRSLLNIEADLADLPPEASQHALQLADAEPELEAYRLAVVKRRSMVMGDLRAMDAYATGIATKRDLQLEQQQASADHAALHDARARASAPSSDAA